MDALPQGRTLRILAPESYRDLEVGESIAVQGICLTAERFEPTSEGVRFLCSAGHETLGRTTLGRLRRGDRLHLERALRLSDRLGGHLVSGHVDTVGKVVGRREAGAAIDLEVRIPERWMPLVAEKGSVALDGVSLTVSSLSTDRFGVMVIPHTRRATLLAGYPPGRELNVETDLVGKYVARMLGHAAPAARDARLLDLLARLGGSS